MQFQSAALKSARAAVRFTGNVASALTSRRAARLYRFTWNALRFTLQAAVVLLVVLGAVAFLLGCGTRTLLTRYQTWADAFVASCEKPTVVLALPPAIEVSATVAEPESEFDPWDGETEPQRVLITPPPALYPLPTLRLLPPAKIEPVVTAKRKRGRPKGSKKKKAA